MFWRISIQLCLVAFSGQTAASATSSEPSTSASGTSAALADAEFDLTGYWKNGDGRILRFTQEGSSLTSRHTKRTPEFVHYSGETDFSATIRGDLVHGAHLTRLPWALHSKCPLDMWVGIGLTLNEDATKLTGFRGQRTVDLISCKVEDEAPVPFVYTRMLNTGQEPPN